MIAFDLHPNFPALECACLKFGMDIAKFSVCMKKASSPPIPERVGKMLVMRRRIVS